MESDLADAESPLRVVVAYSDVAAWNRALGLLADIGEALGGNIDFQPLPWSFDLLADVNWRRVAASDAINADLLILASSDTNPLPPAIRGWAETAISRKRGTAAAVVALFGPEEHPDGTGSSRLKSIQSAAKRAGLDFFAPAPRGEFDDDEATGGINQRVEMVTPLLHEILQRHSASRGDHHTEAP